MKTMKNFKNEPGISSNSHTIFYGYYLFIKDQQPSHKDQLPVQFLVMKTVSTATSVVHRVRILEEQCSIQISTF